VIGVDTNVLVRLFIDDDHHQHGLATRFFDGRDRDDPAFVSVVTTVEFVWVLTRSYKKPAEEALRLLRDVLDSQDAVMEEASHVRAAIEEALATKAEFSDVVIARTGQRAGCSRTVTFDGPAADRIPGMALLT
jgi:predicted nucleic-acid-binding protein